MMNIHGALARKRQELADNGEKGFTLIELLVVVLIIGILTAIAVPIFLGQQDQAKDAGVKSDLGIAKVAVISYYTANPSGGTPTFDNDPATGLAKYGYVESDNTTSISFHAAPSGTPGTFCIVGVSASSGTPSFSISESTGAVNNGTCA